MASFCRRVCGVVDGDIRRGSGSRSRSTQDVSDEDQHSHHQCGTGPLCQELRRSDREGIGGRIKPEVYPASQLGSTPRQIEGTQFGAIQAVVLPPEFFVGVDERFAVLAAPGLVSTLAQAQKVAADPAVMKLMLGLGADKGLHGVGLFGGEMNEGCRRKPPNRHLADFKGKKLRIFAFGLPVGRVSAARCDAGGDVAWRRDGRASSRARSTAPSAGVQLLAGMHFNDAAKYITMTHCVIFIIAEVSKKWYELLPVDLQQVVDRVGAAQSVAINPQALEITAKARKSWRTRRRIDRPAGR